MKKKRLYLVDVSSMFFRAFYAIRHLSSPSGMPTNAIYGFLTMTLKLLRDIHPDYMAFCFDRPEASFRVEIDPRYKAHRSETPEDLIPQIPYIRRVAHMLGISCWESKGFEADDVIGTLATWGKENNLEVVIISGDKDFAQLVDRDISLFDPMKNQKINQEGVIEKWGVRAEQMQDYLSLVGDSSDNIPGVQGVGPKTAVQLLSQFASIEELYASLEQVANPNLRKKLEAGRDEALLSKRLVAIEQRVPLDINEDNLILKPILRDEMSQMFDELGFKSLKTSLFGANQVSSSSSSTYQQQVNDDSSSNTENATIRQNSSIVNNQASSESAAKTIAQSIYEEFDLTPEKAHSFFSEGATVWALSTLRGLALAQGHKIARLQGPAQQWGALLRDKNLLWKGFDLKAFWHKICLPKSLLLQTPQVEDHFRKDRSQVVCDLQLMAYILRPGQVETWEQMLQRYAGETLPELPSFSQILVMQQKLETHLTDRLKSWKDVDPFYLLNKMEYPLLPILYEMELEGVCVDAPQLALQSQELEMQIKVIEEQVRQSADLPTLNVGSPKQLAVVLFEKLGLPTGKKTKTGYSTDNEVLLKLAPLHPICGKILEYRELTKLKSTYVDALPQLINPATGRVHTTFNQALTATGRLSSIQPNLQNIPIRSQRGAMVRRAFVAPPGWVLLSADYSQIELRILAHLSEDPALLRAFTNNIDIHRATAAEVFSVPVDEVTTEQRRRAKAVNFGLLYGQGAHGLAESLQISRREASDIIENYFTRFSRVQGFMQECVRRAQDQGYVETIFGRRRYIDEIHSKSAAVRKFGERAAMNAPIQGTAADIVKLAMIAVREKVPTVKVLLQVHDELIFEVPSDSWSPIAEDVQKAMEGAVQLKVPLDVRVGVGPNWDATH